MCCGSCGFANLSATYSVTQICPSIYSQSSTGVFRILRISQISSTYPVTQICLQSSMDGLRILRVSRIPNLRYRCNATLLNFSSLTVIWKSWFLLRGPLFLQDFPLTILWCDFTFPSGTRICWDCSKNFMRRASAILMVKFKFDIQDLIVFLLS